MSFSSRTRRHVLYAVVITLIAVIAGYKGVLPVFRSHLMRFEKRRFGMAMALSGVLSGLCIFLSMNTVGILTRWLGEVHMGTVMLLPASLFLIVGIVGGVWIILFGRGESR